MTAQRPHLNATTDEFVHALAIAADRLEPERPGFAGLIREAVVRLSPGYSPPIDPAARSVEIAQRAEHLATDYGPSGIGAVADLLRHLADVVAILAGAQP